MFSPVLGHGATLPRGLVAPMRSDLVRKLSARFPVCRAEQPNPKRPEWVEDLMRDAEEDEDVAALVAGTNGDPELIRQRLKASMQGQQRQIDNETAGEEKPMHVEFREVDNFNLWLWFEFYTAPAEREREMLEEVIKSWFVVGRLGGFNSMNLQVMFRGDDDVSFFKYNQDDQDQELPSLFHEMGEVEFRGTWARVFVDMGTADEMGLDILINCLANFSREYVGVKQFLVGGQNVDWPTPHRPSALDDDVPMGDMIGLDPMRMSQAMGDEDDDEIPDDGFTLEDMERLRVRGAKRAEGAGAADDIDIVSSDKGSAPKRGFSNDDGEPPISSGRSTGRRSRR